MSDLSDPVYAEIVAARVKLLFEKPFFGSLAARLILVDASTWCQTIACDGRHLFYNREFIKSLTKQQLLFACGHEVLHCVYDHLGRRGGREKKIWDVANDYIVNDTLTKERVGEAPKGARTDKRFTDEMSSEEVYEQLQQESTTVKIDLGTFDEHLDVGADDEREGEGDGEGQSVEVTITGKDGPPKLSEADMQKIRAELKAAVIQAAQQAGAGKVPAGVLRMIDELVNPRMDWRTLLDAHIRSAVKDDYTFQRLSRRTRRGGAILPSQDFQDTIEVDCWIDCSGSMGENMLRDFLSEVKGIMLTFRDFKLRLGVFDTQVYNVREFTPQNIDEIDTYPMAGGGGTMFECVWEWMKAEGVEPHRLVLFTDGYPCGTWGDPNYCDTLFIVHGGHYHLKAPFGLTCYYEPKGA
jgi:predicted metal-dependent peptidase